MMIHMGLRWDLRRAAVRGLKHASALSDHLIAPPAGIVILAYHRVGRWTRVSVDLPTWIFEEQMERIVSGPGAIRMDAALDDLREGPRAGRPAPVVVTFDDGTADFVDVALPILVRYSVPALLYIATDFVDSGRHFPDAGRPVSWGGLRDAVSTGLVEIGSHTHTHVLLDRTSPADAAAELDRSIDLIGERLGRTPTHFAYPKALAPAPDTEPEVRSRFGSAALAGTRPNPYFVTDPYRLARSPVQVDDGVTYFERKLLGGMHLEDDVRRLAGRWRHARAVT